VLALLLPALSNAVYVACSPYRHPPCPPSRPSSGRLRTSAEPILLLPSCQGHTRSAELQTTLSGDDVLLQRRVQTGARTHEVFRRSALHLEAQRVQRGAEV
jgi:hypothetical protein